MAALLYILLTFSPAQMDLIAERVEISQTCTQVQTSYECESDALAELYNR